MSATIPRYHTFTTLRSSASDLRNYVLLKDQLWKLKKDDNNCIVNIDGSRIESLQRDGQELWVLAAGGTFPSEALVRAFNYAARIKAGRLPDREAVIQQGVNAGLTYAEIALRLGVSTGRVSQLVAEMRQAGIPIAPKQGRRPSTNAKPADANPDNPQQIEANILRAERQIRDEEAKLATAEYRMEKLRLDYERAITVEKQRTAQREAQIALRRERLELERKRLEIAAQRAEEARLRREEDAQHRAERRAQLAAKQAMEEQARAQRQQQALQQSEQQAYEDSLMRSQLQKTLDAKQQAKQQLETGDFDGYGMLKLDVLNAILYEPPVPYSEYVAQCEADGTEPVWELLYQPTPVPRRTPPTPEEQEKLDKHYAAQEKFYNDASRRAGTKWTG